MKVKKKIRQLLEAYKEGVKDGYSDGYDVGWDAGVEKGKADARIDAELLKPIQDKTILDLNPVDPPPPGKRVLHLMREGDGALVCKTPGSVPYTHDESEATCKECLRASKDRQEGYTYDRT